MFIEFQPFGCQTGRASTVCQWYVQACSGVLSLPDITLTGLQWLQGADVFWGIHILGLLLTYQIVRML